MQQRDDVSSLLWWALFPAKQSSVLRTVGRAAANSSTAGAAVVAINGEAIAPGGSVDVGWGTVTITDKGTPNILPDKGWQMEPIWLPSQR